MADIRQFIDPETYAEPKKITYAKLQAYEKGYDKGFRNGNLTGFVVGIGLYMLVHLAGKVL